LKLDNGFNDGFSCSGSTTTIIENSNYSIEKNKKTIMLVNSLIQTFELNQK